MLELLHTSASPLPEWYSSGSLNLFRYFEPWRAFLWWGWTGTTATSNLYKLFHDGTLVPYGTRDGVPNGLDYIRLFRGGLGLLVALSYDPRVGDNRIFKVDEFTLEPVYQDWKPVAAPAAFPVVFDPDRCLVDFEHDFCLLADSWYIYGCKLSTGEQLWRAAFDDDFIARSWPPHLHWVSENQIMLAEGPLSGERLSFWDYTSKVTLLNTRIAAYNRLAYDTINHVIVAVGTDRYVRVYAPAPQPDHFAAVTLTPASPQQWGHAHLSTSLLGDIDEPCKDWRVNWSLAGSKGQLRYAQTKTDANGLTTNYYISPLSVAELGEETVQVEVVI